MYQNLKALRLSLNMNQKDFAASIGLPMTTYRGYESGDREPRSDFWIAVAQKYNVTIDYLMGYSDIPTQVGPVKTKTPAPEEPEAGDKVSIEELTDFLERAGYIQKGGDLSDADFQFLAHLIGLIDLWYQNRQGGK